MEVPNDHSMEFWTAAVKLTMGLVIPPPYPRLTVLAYSVVVVSLTPCE